MVTQEHLGEYQNIINEIFVTAPRAVMEENMKKYYSWLIFIFVFFTVWQIASILIDNSFILPSVITVLKDFLSFFYTKTFYHATYYTLIRVFTGIFFSFLIGVLFAYLCFKNRLFSDILSKLFIILKSLPNVSIIILLLFWISRELTVFVVIFLLLFPIVYENVSVSLQAIQKKWKEVLFIYPQPYTRLIKEVYLPLLKPAIVSSLLNCCSLAFKAGVMAEILGQVQNGIGRQIQYCRVNFELSKVIAWTIWIVILVFLFDSLLKFLLKKTFDD